MQLIASSQRLKIQKNTKIHFNVKKKTKKLKSASEKGMNRLYEATPLRNLISSKLQKTTRL